MIRLMQGDARKRLAELPEASVHLTVCSPPYYSLRSYQTEPQVWGGDPACAHVWGAPMDPKRARWGDLSTLSDKQRSNRGSPAMVEALERDGGSQCSTCGAIRCELGQEPTLAAYIANLVEVFESVRRVLHPTGLLFVNLGSSYSGSPSKGGSGTPNGRNGRGEGYARETRGECELPPGSEMMVPARFALAMQEAGWLLRSEITLVKCLSGGTVLYARTQKGEMPMTVKDLVRLRPETVQLWNGQRWTQVLGFREQAPPPGRGDPEIEFRNGERIGCTREHLWPTQRGNIRADELRVGDVVPNCPLPDPEEPAYAEGLSDEWVGWFVGLYIAEGSRSADTIQIAGHVKEEERLRRLRYIAEMYHGTCAIHRSGENKCTINLNGPVLNGIIDAYVSGKGAAGKHLHPRAWARKWSFLKAVLEGYLSGDGADCGRHWQLGFCKNDAWAQDLRTLCARVGVKLFLRRCDHRLGERVFPGWKGYLRLEASGHYAEKNAGEVVAIRKSRARKFWDIAVADEPHTFALASGLLTHNSNPMPESVTGARWERCRVKVKAQQDETGAGKWQDRRAFGLGEGSNSYSPQFKAEWADCPGCPKCSPHGGLVLRWGSGRPTSATEKLYCFAKTARYFWNQEAVRLPNAPPTGNGGRQSAARQGDPERYAGMYGGSKRYGHEEGHHSGLASDRAGLRSEGANCRNWLRFQEDYTEAYLQFLADHLLAGGASADLIGDAMTAAADQLRDFMTQARDVLEWKPSPLSDAHYAAFPAWLPSWCIKAGTAEQVCSECGAPYAPVLNRTALGERDDAGRTHSLTEQRNGRTPPPERGWESIKSVLGWRATCDCAAPSDVATVLDPFSGAGTTVIAADRLGRHGIGIDLSGRYTEMARARVTKDAGLFAEVSCEVASEGSDPSGLG